jgi:DNA-binding GntR family transcriptional regulator
MQAGTVGVVGRSSTRDRVYAIIRRRILTGELAPGSRLVASRIATSVKASRTPVREAILRLVTEGLADETPAGLVVTDLTEEQIVDLYEVRVPLEATAARLAATQLSSLHLAQIEALHERFITGVGAPRPDPNALAALNLELHRAICHAARNPLLLEFMSRIYDTLGRFRRTTFQHPGRLAEVAAEHDALVRALRERDPARAERVARAHMEHAMAVRLAMSRERYGAPPDAAPHLTEGVGRKDAAVPDRRARG